MNESLAEAAMAQAVGDDGSSQMHFRRTGGGQLIVVSNLTLCIQTQVSGGFRRSKGIHKINKR